jgi:predicted ATPase
MERAAGLVHDDNPGAKLDKLDAVLAQTSTSIKDAALFAEMLSLPNDGRYPALELTPVQRRERTLEALILQMQALTRSSPVLMIFEDAHWTDPTTLEAFGRAVDRIATLRVLLIVTYRPEFDPPWIGRPHVSALTINRLAQREVGAMIDHLVGDKVLPASIREDIIERTDGIPLFVEEMTKAVLEAGSERAAEEAVAAVPLPTLPVPASLYASLMARLDRVGAAKEVAQIGAAIGREFSHALLAAVVRQPEAELRSAINRLIAAGLLFRHGDPPHVTYVFKHALVQDAAYQNLLKSRRRVLHRRIVETLRDRFQTMAEIQPEVVAHHFTQAGLNEAAIEWWVKAGDRALDRSANNEAIAHLEKAISLAEGLADGPAQRLLRLQLQTTYGHALLHGRGHSQPETIAAFGRARELAAGIENAAARFSAYYGMWLISFVRADLAPMREVAVAFLRDARHSLGSSGAGRALHVFGVTCWFQGDYAGARKHLEQALAAYDHERDHHPAPRFVFDDRVVAMGWLAVVLWPLGEVDQAARLLDSALSLARQSGHRPTVAWAHAYTCRFAGIRRKPGQARPHAEELLEVAHEHGLPMRLADGLFYHGWARWCAGDGDGETGMRGGLARWNEMFYRLFAPLTGTLLAEREAEAGRVEVGLATLDAQLTAIEQTGERWFDAEVHRVRGELLLKLQRPDVAAAESAFLRAIEIARSQQTRTFELRAALSLAKLYRTTGRDQVASELLVEALVGFNTGPEVPEVEQAQRLLTIVPSENYIRT